eukprot:TRINITY_DN16698_c0_g1_i2.p2 TRINITY_DN16698_c0_g1~~TRINITY_DN16698_c0_g1_i2.p2  ORF type:complete len:103 (+),score=18.82 TRINITY_DN16698_c0_g1_i2:137-445(+)
MCIRDRLRIQSQQEERQLLIKTQQEVAKSSQVEHNRIIDGVLSATNRLFPTIDPDTQSHQILSPQNKTKGMKLLQSVLLKEQIDTDLINPPKPQPKEKEQTQ